MTPGVLAITCLMAPLVAFFFALVFFRNRHMVAAGIVIFAGLVSAACALMLLAKGAPARADALIVQRWFEIDGVSMKFGALLDGRTLLMGAVVGVITLCIQIYSLKYMEHDPGKGRFFAFLSLFEWAMLSFVYAPNLLQTFICWELVGLASFLLIGFWYRKPTAVAAAKKAFLMTRIGDVGLFIGLILLFQHSGSLDILTIINGEGSLMSSGQIEIVCGLMLMGIVGKSAQFPLHTWLPDAMEGPTPVSALLHSATMVAAGVFLFARFHELFMAADQVLTITLAIATFTAILASTMAMVAKDMKKVLAYSSISQLGFMLIGLAAGGLFAGFFHLTTHAAFKALLFLCAGAFIHAFATNDMVAMGRAGARKMKITTIGLCVGGAALAGLPPLAGFFSKEAIIGKLGAGKEVFLVGALMASFMTAYYTFRMVFFIIRPNADSAALEEEAAGAQSHSDDDHDDDHHDDHNHEPWQMMLPIALLTVGAALLGWFGDHIGDLLKLKVHHPGVGEMAPAIAASFTGVLVAWLDFGRKGASQVGFIHKLPSLAMLFRRRWYIDDIYKKAVVNPVVGLAQGLFIAETKGFDGVADKVGETAIDAGDGLSRTQSGRVQVYVGSAVLLLAAVSLYVGLR